MVHNNPYDNMPVREFHYNVEEDKREETLKYFMGLNDATVVEVRLNTGNNRLGKALASIRGEVNRILNRQERQPAAPDSECPCIITVRVVPYSKDICFMMKLYFYGVTSGDESPCTEELYKILNLVRMENIVEQVWTHRFSNETWYPN